MIVQNIWFNNWSSFYGEHVIDLSIEPDKGANVILFHGETGFGKTSITSGIQWLISGITKKTKTVGEVRTSIIRKPIMWKEDDFAGSLMNLDAFDDGQLEFGVGIEFEHNNHPYRLMRTCSPSSGKWIESDAEQASSFKLQKLNSSETWENEDAQRELNKMIPKRLLQFFVVEGDFIEKYTETLFGENTSLDMKQSVNDAVGVEALHRVTLSLNTISSQTAELIHNINIKNNREDEKIKQYEYYVKRLREVKEEIEQFELDKAHKMIDYQKSKQHLEAFEGIRQTLEKKDRILAAVEAKTNSIEGIVNTNSSNMEDAWKAVLTPIFNQMSAGVEAFKASKRNFDLEIAKKTIVCENLLNHQDSSIPICPICGTECQKCKTQTDPIDIDKINEKVESLQSEINSLKLDLGIIETKIEDAVSMDKIALTERNVSRIRDDYDKLIKVLDEIKSLEYKLNELQDLLVDFNNEDFKTSLRTHDALESEISIIDEEIIWRQSGEDNEESVESLTKKIKQYGNIGNTSTKIQEDLEKANKRKELCDMLSNAFSRVESKYLNQKRSILDATMTSTFRLMITETEQKRTHDSLVTKDDWSVSCLTQAKNVQPIENPGTQRKATLAYLEALRDCSGVEFPIILDNPAAPLESPAKIALSDHFIGKASRQTILLTHSGGWEFDELMNKYSSSIARAFSLGGTSKGDRFRTSLEIKGGALVE